MKAGVFLLEIEQLREEERAQDQEVWEKGMGTVPEGGARMEALEVQGRVEGLPGTLAAGARVRCQLLVSVEMEEDALVAHIQNLPLEGQELQVVAPDEASRLRFAHRMKYHPRLTVA